ncbi:hypothetical protein ACMD2_18851, partial [Ananas comosus]
MYGRSRCTELFEWSRLLDNSHGGVRNGVCFRDVSLNVSRALERHFDYLPVLVLCPRGEMEKSEESFPRNTFRWRCRRVVKEKRAKFYILRRCIAMLLCWRDGTDS